MNINLFTSIFKKKFFNKILFSYIAVLFLAILILAVVISNSISSVLIDKEMEYSDLILYNINQYMEQKIDVTKKIVQQMYYDDLDSNKTNQDVFKFINDSMDKTDGDYITLYTKFSKYFNALFSRDKDICGVVIHKERDDSYYTFAREVERSYEKGEYKSSIDYRRIQNNPIGVLVTKSFIQNYSVSNDRMVYSISMYIKDLTTDDITGEITLDFESDGIRNSLSQYQKQLKGNILVLTEDGKVIYDHSEKNYNQDIPYLNRVLSKKKNVVLQGVKYSVNVNYDNSQKLHIIQIIPQKDILGDTKKVINIIYLVAFICLLAALGLTYFATSFLSKRVKSVIWNMKLIRTGDFSHRIEVGNAQDEISEIAACFNLMCEDISNYIDKVYITDINRKNSELKQKKAEIKAMQAQINPHFIYNTLEAIRMKAVIEGNIEVGDMILLLSKIFRSTIKDQMIIEIRNEIKYCKMYLELFKIRFKDNLEVRYEIADDILDYGILKYSLQPIIENYFVHGFISNKTDNIILIKAYKENADIVFEIKNNGNLVDAVTLEKINQAFILGENNHSDSIGLLNVHERIIMVYGERFGISMVSNKETGTTVTLRISALSQKELESNV